MKKYLQFINEYSQNIILNLKKKFKEENSELNDNQMDYYINSFDKYKQSPKIINKDITKYSFKDLEQLIDTNFPKKIDRTELKNNFTEESIYNKDGLSIYEGDTKEKCIKYGQGYPWCISRHDDSNMFNTYRYYSNEPNFYFIFDSERNDNFSAIVLLINKGGEYYLSNKSNSGDFTGSHKFSWDEISKFQPKIKELKHLFKPKPLTKKERDDYELIKNKTDEELFDKFKSYELVEKYISFNHKLSNNQFEKLPDSLKNKYINIGGSVDYEMFLNMSNKHKKYIKTIKWANLKIESISELPESLEELICYNIQLKSLPELPDSLKELICYGNQLKSLPELPESLKMLWCSNNQLNTLPELTDSLENLICNNNKLESLPELPKLLKKFECKRNQLKSLPELPDLLRFLCCNINQLKSLPELPDSLEHLFCDNNPLECIIPKKFIKNQDEKWLQGYYYPMINSYEGQKKILTDNKNNLEELLKQAKELNPKIKIEFNL